MKKITFLALLGSLIFSSCQEKDPAQYNDLITQARGLYEAGEYKGSGEIYSEAFEAKESKDTMLHRYEAARSWALAGEKDSAFAQLFGITGEGQYADLAQVSSDQSFSSLRTDGRWMEVLKEVSNNNKAFRARLFFALFSFYCEEFYF